MTHDAWQDYISIPYGEERLTADNRPLLDSELAIASPWLWISLAPNYTQIHIPEFPWDLQGNLLTL